MDDIDLKIKAFTKIHQVPDVPTSSTKSLKSLDKAVEIDSRYMTQLFSTFEFRFHPKLVGTPGSMAANLAFV